MSVVVAHTIGFLAPLMGVPGISNIARLSIDHSQPLGALGVELFFVLSGFLIGNILIKIFLNSEVFSFSQIRNFWIRRWFRTLPNYWLILTVNIILYQALNLQPFINFQLLYYFFLQNLWYPAPVFFFNEAWSLSVEEWFYLTLPVVMYLSSVIFVPRDKRSFLLKVFIGYLAAFVLIRFINAFHPINGPEQDSGIRKVVLFRLDAVMYGVLFAYLNNFRYTLLNKLRNLLLVISICGVSIIFYLMAKRSLQLTSSPDALTRFASDAFLYMLLPLFFSMCLPFANSIKNFKSKRLSGSIEFISKISYSMYLVHYTLIFIPFFYKLKPVTIGTMSLLYFFYWVVVLTLSAAIYKYFEKPVMNLRDKIAPK